MDGLPTGVNVTWEGAASEKIGFLSLSSSPSYTFDLAHSDPRLSSDLDDVGFKGTDPLGNSELFLYSILACSPHVQKSVLTCRS